jgi:hypothetical protein
MNVLSDPIELQTHGLPPAGLELMTETVEREIRLGGLACVMDVVSGQIDDATLEHADRSLGGDIPLDFDSTESIPELV